MYRYFPHTGRIAFASISLLILSPLLMTPTLPSEPNAAFGESPANVKRSVEEIEFDLQTRDPATGQIVTTREKVDPKKIGVIAVDVWNYHWCKTATMRVDAFVPRMNKALDAARSLGMTIMPCPSDVVDNYVGYPQREAVLARDMTDAHPGYDPSRDFTLDLNTEQVVEHFEKHLAPTIHFQQELHKLGLWDDQWIVDPVRIAPWGTDARPHLFEEPVTVTLTAPLQRDAAIRYTLDGSEPTESSTLYKGPLTISDSARLRASAFRNGKPVCLESVGAFEHMGPLPPLPDVYLGDLQPIRSVGFGHTYGGEVRYSGETQPPQPNRSNRGQVIKINRQQYERGLGVHAPCELVYQLKPEYRRFVGLAGVDEHLISRSNGSNWAKFPSVIFRVFIDGRQTATSPVIRILSPAWRFDVQIPQDARIISIVTMDAGDGSREDYADWANAGFVVNQ